MICDKHGEYEKKELNILGKNMVMPCPACTDEARADEKVKKDALHKSNAEKSKAARIKFSCLPKKYQKFTVEDCRKIYPSETARAMQWLYDARLNASSLLFIGPKGTGKTTLACVMLKEWCDANTGLFTTMFAMSKESHADGTEKFISPPLLVIDEAGRQMGTEAEKNRIFEIINERYNAERPTIFITNMKKSVFEETMGAAVYDRIQENQTEIKMVRESLRLL